MTLRLVLVSLVAGLGLGLPAWPTIEGCAGGVQEWMNSRLAQWDVRSGDGVQFVLIHDLLKEEMRLNRTEHRVELPDAGKTATTLLEATSLTWGGAALLPSLDGLLRPSAPVRPSVPPDELVGLVWNRILPTARGLVDDFAQSLRTTMEREALAEAFTAMEASDTMYFDGDFSLDPEPELQLADLPEPATELTSDDDAFPGFEVLEQSVHLYFAPPLAEEMTPLLEMATLVDDESPAFPDDVFAPYEPTILAESQPTPPLEAPSEPLTTSVEPSRDSEVGQAMRLTREAVSAWLNVLTNPAVLTVSQRSTTSPR